MSKYTKRPSSFPPEFNNLSFRFGARKNNSNRQIRVLLMGCRTFKVGVIMIFICVNLNKFGCSKKKKLCFMPIHIRFSIPILYNNHILILK